MEFYSIVDVSEMSGQSQKTIRRCGGIGRRKGLKIPRWQHRAGSTPASGTKKST